MGDADVSGGGFEALAGFVCQPHSLFELPYGWWCNRAIDESAIGFGDAEFWMGEAIGQLAVVGEQEQALGFGVEPADGIKTGFEIFWQQVNGAGLHALSDVGGINAFGFVEQEIIALL